MKILLAKSVGKFSTKIFVQYVEIWSTKRRGVEEGMKGGGGMR